MTVQPAKPPELAEMLRMSNRALEGWVESSSTKSSSGVQLVTPLPGLRVVRYPVRTQFEATIYEPIVCLILQGRKETTFGGRTFRMGAGECVLVSHDLPVVSRVVEVPYLALLFQVDIEMLRSLTHELGSQGRDQGSSALEVHAASPLLLGAVGRYLGLLDSPADAKVLGPMIIKEIHYRLLREQGGGMLRSLIDDASHSAVVSRAIAVIRRDFRSSIVVADLARDVGMSVASFHRHFKAVTSLSPLQYQKELRLLEAQRLLNKGAETVSRVAFDVGYESLSQFSREYSRKFGHAPNRDLVGKSDVHLLSHLTA